MRVTILLLSFLGLALCNVIQKPDGEQKEILTVDDLTVEEARAIVAAESKQSSVEPDAQTPAEDRILLKKKKAILILAKLKLLALLKLKAAPLALIPIKFLALGPLIGKHLQPQYIPVPIPQQYDAPEYAPPQYAPQYAAPQQYAPPQYAPQQDYAPPQQYSPPQYSPPQYSPPQQYGPPGGY